MEPKSECNVCNKSAGKSCSRCKAVHYCSRECQKADWKRHKLECFAPGTKCTRCLKVAPFSSPVCRVPHPNHLRVSQGSMYGGNVEEYYSCEACSKSYTLSGPTQSDLKITKGPKWCYKGSHTMKPIHGMDKRKVYADAVVIKGTAQEMNQQIRALDGNEDVKILKLQNDGYYDGSEVVLDVSLPCLEEVQLEDVGMKRIVLNQELTPNVEKLWMQNPTELDEPDFTILCPKLKQCTIYYWGPGNYKWVCDMLETATVLEEFDSYKLRVSYLQFASNHLRSIRLHRAELLERVDLWAPRLVDFNVQAAYDLEQVHFLKNHALKDDLPQNFTFQHALEVNADNAILGSQAVEEILAHPRFHGTRESLKGDDDDDDYFHF